MNPLYIRGQVRVSDTAPLVFHVHVRLKHLSHWLSCFLPEADMSDLSSVQAELDKHIEVRGDRAPYVDAEYRIVQTTNTIIASLS